MKIIVGGRFDYIQFAWQPMIDSGEVQYFTDGVFCKRSFGNKIRARWERFLGKFSKKAAENFAKKNDLREYFDIDSLKKKDEILFVLYETNFLSTDFAHLEYLKKRYPKAKFVLHLTNPIGTVRPEATKLLIQNIGFYDTVYTFNRLDAEKYGFRLFPDISGDYSSIQAAPIEEFDVFYAGRAKTRLDRILTLAKTCIRLGLKIRFFVTEVPEEEQQPIEGVFYNQFLPYLELLAYEKRAKAILNLLQGVSSGIILRDEEAMGMNKILITDNDYIFHSEYYTESKIIPFDRLEEQIEKITKKKDTEAWNASVKKTGISAFLNCVFEDLNIEKENIK